MNLTPNFSEAELLRSSTALRLGIDNSPSDEVRDNLQTLAEGLERIRSVLCCAMHITSGYRSPKLNAAIRGAKRSAHMDGLAADFVAPGFGTPREIARLIADHKEFIAFNRVIEEGNWVHVDFPLEGVEPAKMLFTAHFSGGAVSYTGGLDD